MNYSALFIYMHQQNMQPAVPYLYTCINRTCSLQ